jgi:hypothetical protein
MLFFYDTPEIPFFHKNRSGVDTPSSTVVDEVDPGAGTVGDNLHTRQRFEGKKL